MVSCAAVFLVGALAGSCAKRVDPRKSDARTVLARILEIDRNEAGIHHGGDLSANLTRYQARLRNCGAESESSLCALEAILGSEGLSPAHDADVPAANTVTHTLASGEGTCAALVGAVLSLADSPEALFEAVILRDHVLLGSARQGGVYYEVLEGGRQVTDLELRSHAFPPGGPVRVDAEGYIPYYIDNLAARFAGTGSPRNAERLFSSALELAPDAARIRYNFGTFLLDEDRYEEALANLDRAIRLDWDNGGAWINRGVALLKLGQTREARRSFETALERDPGNREASENLRRLDQHGGTDVRSE